MGAHQFSASELEIQPVDEESAIPFYQQIRMDLLHILESGIIKPGDMLPTEFELAKAYHVSRQTIRQAIGILEFDGYVERTPGRGTTVQRGTNRIKLFIDQSFARQMLNEGLTPHSKVLEKKLLTIDESSPPKLQSMKGCSALQLYRLRYVNGNPIGIEYSTTIIKHCPDLPNHDFSEQSLYDLLLTTYKLPIGRIDQTVSASFADEWHMKLLNLHENSPLLIISTTSFLENGEPLETSTGYYRSDKYEFSISQFY